jgi:urea transport system permease protein
MRAWAGALALACLLLTCLAAAGAARADDPFAALASQSFERIRGGIEALSTSGNPRATAVITALQAHKLVVGPDHTLYIKGADDSLTDARTGQPVATAPDELKPVRVNNAVREAIESAIGTLTLLSPDPAKRRAAAGDVFHSRNPAAVPALTHAIAVETEPGIRLLMQQARAAAILATTTASETDRLDAVATLAARGDLEARSILGSLTSGQPAAVTAAAAAAVASLQRIERMWSLAQDVVYGLSLGSVLLLAAAGLAITFGVMGVINMAHGELVMLGAYTTYVIQEAIRTSAPGLFGISLFLAVPAAFIVSGGAGIVIERCLIRFLYGRPLETLLATWGLSLVLQQAVRTIFGPSNREVGTPDWMSGATSLGGLTLTWNRIVIIVFAVVVIAALMLVLRATPLGLRMRAVTQNRRMAAAMGIRTPWIDALTFGLGSGVAGMAGVALSQIDNVSPNLGQGYIIDSFMVVVFGGVGNLWGTVVSALTLGILNKLLEPFAGAVLGKIVVLVLLIAFIQRKPRGLFPLKGRAVEA